MMTEKEFLAFMDSNGFLYQRLEHPAVFTMLGLANDAEHKVELWMDAEIWQSKYFLSHPLVNTATLVISKSELEQFFILTGHTLHLFEGT
jgi:hypothetical protein